jgi:Tat-targeted selenate reductase subunit YnfE
MPYTYGSNDGNSTSDIENSKLVVMFGNNPAETRMSGGGITWYLEQARERSNARMIVIDPRYTDTAAGRKMSGSHSSRHRRRAGGRYRLGAD